LKTEFNRLQTLLELRRWSCPEKQQVVLDFNMLFIYEKYEMRKNSSQMKWEKGEKITQIFILVHSSSRGTSSPLHNNAKISTKSYKFTYTNTYKTQSWTLQDCLYPLCGTPPHKMHNPSAICRTLLLCLMQTIHPKQKLTRLHNTQCLKTLFKQYTTKNWCKNELQLQESIMQQLK